MIFDNPVAGLIVPYGGRRPSSRSPIVSQAFGPTSCDWEPSMAWQGGEGIAANWYRYFHRGMDIWDGGSGTPILAMAAGRVWWEGRMADTNIVAIIDHGGSWGTGYGHLMDTVINRGQLVSKGQVIGHMGSSGHSTGPHLDVQVKSGVTNWTYFYSASVGKLRNPWLRLRQNITVFLSNSGVNLRSTASTALPPLATTKDDGLIWLASGASAGPMSMPRRWGGTVTGGAWTLFGVTGKTWEKFDMGGTWAYVATPLARLSAT